MSRPDAQSPTVLLPVGPGFEPAALRRTLAALEHQTLPPAEVLIIANGLTDAQTRSLNDTLASPPASTLPLRIFSLERANLAAALNLGLREARTPLVARMDADDWCHPRRLELQTDCLSRHPDLVGVACAWEVVDDRDALRAVMRPPTDPARLRWRLRLGNMLAHGSMLLRRDPVLAAGGYNPELPRAQDYDLWLRLTRDRPTLTTLPDVLYRYTERTPPGISASSPAQARAAADAMLAAWSDLPPSDADAWRALSDALTDALQHDAGTDALSPFEACLDASPTREGLLALLWASDRFPPLPRRAIDLCRRARVREVGARIRAAGADRLWIWGAGQHTARLLQHPDDLGLPIAGLIDDNPTADASRLAHRVLTPDALTPGSHVLLSSDAHEDALWRRSSPLRARDIHCWRLYDNP